MNTSLMTAGLLAAACLTGNATAAPAVDASSSSGVTAESERMYWDYAYGATAGEALYWAIEATYAGYIIVSDPYVDWIHEVQAWGWKVDILYVGY